MLGSVLIDPESIRNIADSISDSDFYVAEHRQIFAAMLRLFSTSNQIDVVTLIDDLVRDGVYDKSGGEGYIRMLIDSVPSALNIRDYAKIVKEKSLLRSLVEAGEDIAERAYSEQDDVGSLLDYAGNKIYSIAQGRDDRSFISIEKVLLQVYEHLHQLQTDPEASQGTKTGFSDLDEVLHMRDDLFTVIAGAIKNQVRRLKEEKMSTKASVLYLNILNETKTMVLQARNLIKSQGYFLSALKESDNKYTDVN